MKRKPIRIDWRELELAFDESNEELAYFLDLVNGHVVLEGEGEDGAFEDDDERLGANSGPRVAAGRDNTRAYVDRLTPATKIAWFERFLAEEPDLDPTFAAMLREALEDEDPIEAAADLLAEDIDGKDRWYRYRADRLHERIDEWLERHQLAFVEPPPWK